MYRSVYPQPLAGQPRRVLIATGGTGGHLFPAVALAQDLTQQHQNVQVCFSGGGLHRNPFLEVADGPWAICPITAPRFGWRNALRFVPQFWKGVRESCHLLEQFRPHLVVGFGSYHTAPILYAARKLSIPYVLHEGNAVPGKVNRLFSQGASCTAVHFAAAAAQLRGYVTQVAMPLRRQFHVPFDQQAARVSLGLAPDLPTLLVVGGSLGAQALNELMFDSAPLLGQLGAFQVIHLAGPRHQGQVERLATRYQNCQVQGLVKRFEERMELAWRAADCCLARAGASSLAEQMACNVPGILVPFPAATDDHQTQNALSFASQAGGAIVMPQYALSPQRLVTALHELMADEKRSLKRMRETMQLRHAAIALHSLSDIVSMYAGWKRSN